MNECIKTLKLRTKMASETTYKKTLVSSFTRFLSISPGKTFRD